MEEHATESADSMLEAENSSNTAPPGAPEGPDATEAELATEEAQQAAVEPSGDASSTEEPSGRPETTAEDSSGAKAGQLHMEQDAAPALEAAAQASEQQQGSVSDTNSGMPQGDSPLQAVKEQAVQHPHDVDKQEKVVLAGSEATPELQTAAKTDVAADTSSSAEAVKAPVNSSAEPLPAKSSKQVHAAHSPAPQPVVPAAAATLTEQAADDSLEDPPQKVKSPRKETAAERLTTPTAMRMLKQLEQTQGGKAEWHIATGVAFKSKKLSPDEMSAMVDRLCTPKHEADNLPPKPTAVKLVFEGTKEVLVPVKQTSQEDNISYMANLYTRCQETRAKTQAALQEKWLQPLIKPKQAAK